MAGVRPRLARLDRRDLARHEVPKAGGRQRDLAGGTYEPTAGSPFLHRQHDEIDRMPGLHVGELRLVPAALDGARLGSGLHAEPGAVLGERAGQCRSLGCGHVGERDGVPRLVMANAGSKTAVDVPVEIDREERHRFADDEGVGGFRQGGRELGAMALELRARARTGGGSSS
jgi:hypothetical protein